MIKLQTRLLDDPNYDPDHLLDTVISSLALKNDAALSRALGVTPSLLSKVRHRRLPVAADLIIRIHEATAFSIAEIRDLMGGRAAPNAIAAGERRRPALAAAHAR